MFRYRPRELISHASAIPCMNRRHRRALQRCVRVKWTHGYVTVISARENWYYLDHQRRWAAKQRTGFFNVN